jgi:uncharacterized protein (TIGR02302 family)
MVSEPGHPNRPRSGASPAGEGAPEAVSLIPALEARIRAARALISAERAWTLLVPPLAVVAAFLAFAWFGGFLALPPLGRAAAAIAFAAALLFTLWRLRGLEGTDRESAVSRLDRDSGLAHRPALTQVDRLGIGAEDATTRALWDLHRRRSAAALSGLSLKGPRPEIARRDPTALRVAAFLAAVAGLVVAGPEWHPRLMAAFAWSAPTAPLPAPRLDAWINPPAYTDRPPIFLARSDRPAPTPAPAELDGSPSTPPAPRAPAEAPVKSIVVIRATPGEGVEIAVEGGAIPIEPETPTPAAAAPPAAQGSGDRTPGAHERRFTLEEDAVFVVSRDGAEIERFAVTAQPDRPPSVTFVGAERQQRGDGLVIRFRASDDYGVANARADLSPATPGAGGRTLYPAPQIGLGMPASRSRAEADLEHIATLPDHPWAGARLAMRLVVGDDAGQTATSAAREVVLPQRAFTNPVAKALVEQRRLFVFAPDDRSPVQVALDALGVGAERFEIAPSEYLALRMLSTRLKAANTDAQLVDVAEGLWRLALDLENAISAAERRLRQAEQALREALERGASPEEIARLTEELRQAMNEYMREFAERNRDNPNMQAQNDQNARTLEQRDMQEMLREIERLSREGKTEEAQRLLQQLQEAMRNLRMAEGRNGQNGRQQQMRRQMGELDRLQRDQQQLRDRTHRDAQRRRNGQQGEQGQQGQEGQQGQQGQGQQGQGQQGQGQQGQGGLQGRQQQLRERLDALRRGMEQNGMQGEQGFADAEGAMREAEEALGRGDGEGAVDAQGRALEALRRGAQGLAQQMQQQQQGQEGDGSEQALGDDQPGRNGQDGEAERDDNDPLGRPQRTRDLDDGRDALPGATPAERAARVLEELRRRLGDFERPRLELDYFERLLPRN